jgi:flagellar basal body P-ring formation protein FlgA
MRFKHERFVGPVGVVSAIALAAALGGRLVAGAAAAGLAIPDSPPRGSLVLSLLTNATVDGEGVFLPQLVEATPAAALPNVRVADAPALGQAIMLTRTQLFGVMQKAALELVSSHWVGAERVRITRRSRVLHEAELKEQLTAVLQRDCVKEKGELEIRLLRPWLPMLIPDEPYTVKILDLPTPGGSAHFFARFEINPQRERVGAWQAPLQARVWREIWVARTPVRSGMLLSEADMVRERRDVLNLRDALLPDHPPAASAVEVVEAVLAGSPLYLRSVRLRPVVRRGQVIEAQFVDGPMTISLKVEVLENGAPGQLVRVRNLQSKREFKGKVQDEQRILVLL